jgi:hypothetical protein
MSEIELKVLRSRSTWGGAGKRGAGFQRDRVERGQRHIRGARKSPRANREPMKAAAHP